MRYSYWGHARSFHLSFLSFFFPTLSVTPSIHSSHTSTCLNAQKHTHTQGWNQHVNPETLTQVTNVPLPFPKFAFAKRSTLIKLTQRSSIEINKQEASFLSLFLFSLPLSLKKWNHGTGTSQRPNELAIYFLHVPVGTYKHTAYRKAKLSAEIPGYFFAEDEEKAINRPCIGKLSQCSHREGGRKRDFPTRFHLIKFNTRIWCSN